MLSLLYDALLYDTLAISSLVAVSPSTFPLLAATTVLVILFVHLFRLPQLSLPEPEPHAPRGALLPEPPVAPVPVPQSAPSTTPPSNITVPHLAHEPKWVPFKMFAKFPPSRNVHPPARVAMPPFAECLVGALGERDATARGAAVMMLQRARPVDLAPLAARIVPLVSSPHTPCGQDALLVLSRLGDAFPSELGLPLIGHIQRAAHAVQRVAILAPAPLAPHILATFQPDSPLCAPKLRRVTGDFDGPDDEAEAPLVAMLGQLGREAIGLALLALLPLRARRALAIAAASTRKLITPHLRAPELLLAESDGTWDNAAFIARLPDLRRLRIAPMGLTPEQVIDLGHLAASAEPVEVLHRSLAACLMLGAALGDRLERIRLVGGRVLECAPLRTQRTLDALDQVLLAQPDVNVLKGVLARNPHVPPEHAAATLRSRERALARMTITNIEAETLLAHAVQAAVAAHNAGNN